MNYDTNHLFCKSTYLQYALKLQLLIQYFHSKRLHVECIQTGFDNTHTVKFSDFKYRQCHSGFSKRVTV